MKLCHLLVANLDPGGIGASIQGRLHGQAGAGMGGADPLHHRFIRRQGLPAPVLGDGGEPPMFDFVPFAGARREVANGDRQAGLVGPTLQFPFPPVVAGAVATPAVGGDQPPSGLWVGGPSQGLPPLANAGHGKDGGVVIRADRHAPHVSVQVVHAVGKGFALTQVRKIIDVDRRRLARRVPFPPGVFEGADQLALFGIHRNHRLSLGLI